MKEVWRGLTGNRIAGQRSSGRSVAYRAAILLLAAVLLAGRLMSLDGVGLSSGFSHPLTGWDHVLTMLAVGVWAAQLRGHAVWMLPMTFVGVMSLGGFAGAAGFALPNVENIVLLSCAAFSMLIVRNVRFSNRTSAVIVAFFAFFHGFAHGQEISASAGLISYTAGFMLATLLLHGAGMLVAKLLVLAVGCLVTVLFSGPALAKIAQTQFPERTAQVSPAVRVDQNVDYFALFAQVRGFPAMADAGFSAPGFQRASSHFEIPETLQAETPQGKAAAGTAAASDHPARFQAERGGSEAVYCQLTALNARIDSADTPGIEFKRYYPTINATPGKSARSDAVGQTSPPLLSLANPICPPVVTPPLPFFVEDSVVQTPAVFGCSPCTSVASNAATPLQLVRSDRDADFPLSAAGCASADFDASSLVFAGPAAGANGANRMALAYAYRQFASSG
ncbi:HupE/UreJ family protein [Methylomonas rhizoryzae]|uniref:HupE/UreJ family protein n=1 Tax=Methylomonas rhizoryzae TaxID=2608981 RepID=UPI001232AC64|nr:HupE/UreJ family protein [Methylomonas rhizoryzae]